MKNIKYTLGILCIFLFSLSLSAQTDPGRTTKTKVIDVLAQLPAENGSRFDQLMSELIQTGEEGVMQIVSMMHAPGQGDNTQMEYALNGMARFIIQNAEKENARKQLAGAYASALQKVSDKEIKFFIITQLGLIGKEESVPTLSTYLNDERLSGVATRALVTINTTSAGQAVITALSSASGTPLLNLIKAAGDMQLKDAETVVTSKINSSNREEKQTALTALSRLGTITALPVLKEAAQKESFVYNNQTTATDAYLYFLNRMLTENNDRKQIEKEALQLEKAAKKSDQIHVKCFAMNLLINIQGNDALPLVVKAMDNESRVYRQAVLSYAAASMSGEKLQEQMLKKLKKVKPEAKWDILDYFALKGDQSVVSSLSEYTTSKDKEIAKKAIAVIGKIGGDEALNILVKQLEGNDSEILAATQAALLVFKGEIAKSLLATIDTFSRSGQEIAVTLIGKRAYAPASTKVFSLLTSTNPAISKAAYKALQGVATEKEIPQLFSLMDKENNQDNIASIQNAILAAFVPVEMSVKENMLLKQSEKAATAQKANYYYLLGRVGSTNTDILNIFFDQLAKGNAKDKEAAIQNLNIWNDHKAVINRSLKASREQSGLAGILFPVIINHVKKGNFTPEQQLLYLRDAFAFAGNNENKNTVLKAIANAKTLQGLLFAGKYLNDPALQQSAAVAVMKIALSNPSIKSEEVTKYLNKVIEVLQGPDSQYEKEAIRKHLAEMDNTPGFVSIFNEKDLTGWKGLVANPMVRSKTSASKLAEAQKKADEVMRNGWVVENGELVFTGKGDNICTEKKYGDFEMIVDWKLDPNGPEPDAGIYLRGTPQVQIWDIARTDVGAQVGSGGLYNNSKHERNPSHVADNPLGEWNTFRIIMKGDRVTVYLNGELVVNNIIMENYWNRSLPIPALEQIELQAHGSKVYYRDVYVREIERPEPFKLSAQEEKEGFKVLFDGTNMHEWIGNIQNYVIEEGNIVHLPKNGGSGNLYTKNEYKDFTFRFEFMLSPGSNNGLGVRTPTTGDAAYVGMELQILDNDAPVYKDLAEYQYHGSVYGVITAKRGYLKPIGEWNYQEVTMKGSKIKITLNGTVILDGDIAEASKNGTLDKRDHPGLKNEKGHIGFLGHGSIEKFRNIRIKELK